MEGNKKNKPIVLIPPNLNNTLVKLTGLPRQISASVYDEVRETVKQKYSNIPGVKAVVETGRVLLPGISDIDFLVITEANAAVDIPRFNTYSDDHQYAMSHKHFVVSEDAYKKFQCIDPWIRGVTPILGGDEYSLPPTPFDEEGRRALSLFFLGIAGSFGFFKIVAHAKCAKQIDCRSFLEAIKYIGNYEREMRNAGLIEINESLDSKIPLYAQIREQWFTLSEDKREQMLTEALDGIELTLAKIIKLVNNDLKKTTDRFPSNSLRKPKNSRYPHSLVIDTGDETIVFQEGREDVEVKCEIYRPLLTHLYAGYFERMTYLFPLELSALITPYFEQEGPLSEKLMESSVTDLNELPILRNQGLIDRAQMTNQNLIETSKVSAVKQPSLTFGYQIKPTHETILGKTHKYYDWFMELFTRTKAGQLLIKNHITLKY